jgi:hypothetical protein
MAESIPMPSLRELFLFLLENGKSEELARLPSLWLAARFETCLENCF